MAKARAIPDLQGTDAFREAAAKAVAVRADELWEHAGNVLDVGDIIVESGDEERLGTAARTMTAQRQRVGGPPFGREPGQEIGLPAQRVAVAAMHEYERRLARRARRQARADLEVGLGSQHSGVN